jgi:hypothetical protein
LDRVGTQNGANANPVSTIAPQPTMAAQSTPSVWPTTPPSAAPIDMLPQLNSRMVASTRPRIGAGTTACRSDITTTLHTPSPSPLAAIIAAASNARGHNAITNSGRPNSSTDNVIAGPSPTSLFTRLAARPPTTAPAA